MTALTPNVIAKQRTPRADAPFGSRRRARASLVWAMGAMLAISLAGCGKSATSGPPIPPDEPSVSGAWNYQIVLTGLGWNCILGQAPVIQIIQNRTSFTGSYAPFDLACTDSVNRLEFVSIPGGDLTNGSLRPASPSWNVSLDFDGLWSHAGTVSALAGTAHLLIGQFATTLDIPGVGPVAMNGSWEFLR